VLVLSVSAADPAARQYPGGVGLAGKTARRKRLLDSLRKAIANRARRAALITVNGTAGCRNHDQTAIVDLGNKWTPWATLSPP
jgi:hypothetical protein